MVTLPQVVATDIADPNPVVTLDQSSGFFPLGTTTINVTAIDASGNKSTGVFAVTVSDHTPPAIALPLNLVVEANATGGAMVALPQVVATDIADPNPVVTLEQSSGFFPLGETTVQVRATDASGNASTGAFSVTVVDTTAPVIAVSDLIFQANTVGGAMVTLAAVTATDIADPSPTVTQDQSSGFFPLGTTPVDVIATDASGNTSTATYTVTVVNMTAPTFLASTMAPENVAQGASAKHMAAQPADSSALTSYDMIVEANTTGGAIVALPTVTATDVADPNPLVTYDHFSGFFPLGTTPVNVSVTDSSGNSTTGTFTVTVIDTTPPKLMLPANLEVAANVQGGGAQVTLPTTMAMDIADPDPVITYAPSSGFFPMGATTVNVTAEDASGNTSSGSFTVTVVNATPPTVSPPANVVVQASSATGAMVTLPQASATDLVDPNPS